MTLPTLVTVVRGRHHHLRRQRRWIEAMEPAPMRHVVVALGDEDIAAVLNEAATHRVPTTLVEMPVRGALPLAAGRNRGVEVAAQLGAETVVLLDVDCLPEARLAAEHAAALDELAPTRGPLAPTREPVTPTSGPVVVSGRVRYLPSGLSDAEHTPARLELVGKDHAARTVPDHGPVIGDPNLLWSLNIAFTVDDFRKIGGFDERYVGYGGEDTDLGRRLAAAGGTMWWSGRAGAFHQYHPVSRPPVEHAADIARNATLFRSIWGDDPMSGWLEELDRMGLVRRTVDGWEATGADAPACPDAG